MRKKYPVGFGFKQKTTFFSISAYCHILQLKKVCQNWTKNTNHMGFQMDHTVCMYKYFRKNLKYKIGVAFLIIIFFKISNFAVSNLFDARSPMIK